MVYNQILKLFETCRVWVLMECDLCYLCRIQFGPGRSRLSTGC